MGWGDIIVFGAIAAFVLLRYRAMLGEQHGKDFEERRQKPREPETEYDRIIQLPQRDAQARPTPVTITPTKEYPEPLGSQFSLMKTIDRQFDPETFAEGAKAAFEMVIEAFNDADRKTLRELLSKEIYKNFDAVLKEREASDTHPHTTLVAILSAEPTKASLRGNVATIEMKFVSEQIQVTKNAAKEVIDGNSSQVENVEDIWTFERNLASGNPAWVITQT